VAWICAIDLDVRQLPLLVDKAVLLEGSLVSLMYFEERFKGEGIEMELLLL
jgi:hypothetical protein